MELSIIEGVTISIGLLAILATYTGQRKAQEHNMLSLKPYLSTGLSMEVSSVTYNLMNQGLGPAIISSFRVFWDEEELKGIENKPTSKLVEKVFEGTKYKAHSSIVKPGYCINQGDVICVAEVEIIEGEISEEEFELRKAKLKILIEYESFYGEKLKFNSQDYNT